MAVTIKNIEIQTAARNMLEFEIPEDYDILNPDAVTLTVYNDDTSTDYTTWVIDHASRTLVIYFANAATDVGLARYELWLEEHDTSKTEIIYKGAVEWL